MEVKARNSNFSASFMLLTEIFRQLDVTDRIFPLEIFRWKFSASLTLMFVLRYMQAATTGALITAYYQTITGLAFYLKGKQRYIFGLCGPTDQ